MIWARLGLVVLALGGGLKCIGTAHRYTYESPIKAAVYFFGVIAILVAYMAIELVIMSAKRKEGE